MSSAAQGGGWGRGRVPPSSGTESRRQRLGTGRQSDSSHSTRLGSPASQAQRQMQRRNRPQSRVTPAPHPPRTNATVKMPGGASSSGAERKTSLEEEWLAIQKSMEAERADAIARGLIADPERPRSLAEATTPVGTCQDMCPKSERVQRLRSNDVWREEWDPAHAPAKIEAQHRIVKKFRRAAAGVPEQLPSELRPPPILQKTVGYLLQNLMDETSALENIHHFVWDRSRAIRNDFSIQQVTELSDVRIAIDCYERIARFHILSLHQLARSPKPYDMYDAFQEREQLARTLLSLTQYYNDTRQELQSPNEAEFRAYCIIRQIQDPVLDLEDTVQSWPREMEQDPRVQMALKLYAAAATITNPRGHLRPRQQHLVAQANWSRFWSLIRSNQTSYLMACVAETYFPLVRKMALNAIWRTYRQGGNTKSQDWSLAELIGVFGFDDEDQVQTFCGQYGFRCVEREDGMLYLDLSSVPGKQLRDPSGSRFDQSFSFDLVEFKRNRRTFSAVVNGISINQARRQDLIEESEDEPDVEEEAESDSLFIPTSHNLRNGSNPRSKGNFENNQDAMETSGQSKHALDVESSSSMTGSGKVVAPAKSSSLEERPGNSNGPATNESPVIPNNPFSFSKPSHSPFEMGASSKATFGFGKPSQPRTSDLKAPTAISGFGNHDASTNSGSLGAGSTTVFPSPFSQANQSEKSLGENSAVQTQTRFGSASAISKPPVSTVDETHATKFTSPSVPTSNPFTFSTAKTTGAGASPSNPFAPTATPPASFTTPIPANKLAMTTTPKTSGSIQKLPDPFLSPTDSALLSGNTAAAAESPAPISAVIHATGTASEDQQQIQSHSAASLDERITRDESDPKLLNDAPNHQEDSHQPLSASDWFSQSQPQSAEKTKIPESAYSDSAYLKEASSSTLPSEQSGFSSAAVAQKRAQFPASQQAQPTTTSFSGSPSLASTASSKVPSSYQSKHQPSRPSPLSHVTTFTSDASPSSQVQSKIGAVQKTLNVGNATSSSQPIASQQMTKLSDADSNIDILGALTLQVLLDEKAGFMKQFVEHVSGREIESALFQFKAEQVERKALDMRNNRLARKYGCRWRENFWKRKMTNKGRERRKRKARELAMQEATQRTVSLKDMLREPQKDAAETNSPLRRKKLQEHTGHRKRRSNEMEMEAVEGASKKTKGETMLFHANSHIPGGNDGDPVVFEHIRDPASFIQPRQPRRVQTAMGNNECPPTATGRNSPKELYPRSFSIDNSLSGNRDAFSRSDYCERASTTQSSYFRLKAMGINPNASGTRKRPRESSVAPSNAAVEPDKVGKEEHFSPPERKKLQTEADTRSFAKPRAQRMTAAPIPRPSRHDPHNTDYSPAGLRQYRAAAEAADEALFDRLRRARGANAPPLSASPRQSSRSESRSGPRLTRNSKPSESQAGSKNQGAAGDSDILAQSRQLREMMADSIKFFQDERKKEDESRSRASSRASPPELGESFSSSESRGLSSSGRSQEIPKYRMRESKFVPRDMYGKWDGTGRLRNARTNDWHREGIRDEGTAQGAVMLGDRQEKTEEEADVDEDIQSHLSPVALADSYDAEDKDNGNMEDDYSSNDDIDGEEEEEDVQEEEFDDEDDEAVEDEAGFIPMGSRFGVLANPASDMAFRTPLPSFDPKGKTGTSAEDAFELSD